MNSGLIMGVFTLPQRKIPQSTAYLKLHGSFNWYYCWNCEHFSIVRDASIGLNCTLLREGHDLVSVGNLSACSEETCLESTHSPIGQAVLKPLIIPPARIKEYQQATIRRRWAFFDLLLAQARQVILVGTSVSDEDVLLVNSLNLLRFKNQQLERIVVIDPREQIAAKVETLAGLKQHGFRALRPTSTGRPFWK
jgi:hypothetical protein